MCGLVGVVTSADVGVCLYDTLTVLQHRGQDAAGIMTSDNGKLNQRKDNGLIKDVFRTRHMRRLVGQMGIGHVRYPTAGSTSPALAQPFYVNSPYGLALAHNGNLTNAAELSRDLFNEDLRHINTDSDSEVLLNVFAHELQCRGNMEPTSEDLFAAVSGVHDRCRGGFAAVVMITGCGILGFRDRNGIRPLVFGSRQTDRGSEYMIASESVALDSQGFTLERDIAPGEAVFIDVDGNPCESSATLSEAIMYSLPRSVWRLPNTNGRIPLRSRNPRMPHPVIITTAANPPRHLSCTPDTAANRSSEVGSIFPRHCNSWANTLSNTSESESVLM
jgi:amidophosphoribosyltransferase